MRSKKSMVCAIRTKLNKLGVAKDGCFNLNIKLPNGDKLNWVGYNQVMISVNKGGSLFRNKRYQLYSKEVSNDMLELIDNNI